MLSKICIAEAVRELRDVRLKDPAGVKVLLRTTTVTNGGGQWRFVAVTREDGVVLATGYFSELHKAAAFAVEQAEARCLDLDESEEMREKVAQCMDGLRRLKRRYFDEPGFDAVARELMENALRGGEKTNAGEFQ